jgi:hypothetical protein
MSTQLASDIYGRSVSVETVNGQDVYTVTDPNTEATFSVSFSTGTPQSNAYTTINAMPASVTPPAQTALQIYTAAIQFAVANTMAGITQAGQTQAVMNYTADLAQCLSSGSLYAAMTDIEVMIADTSSTKTSLSPFITNAILYSYLNQLQAYLGVTVTPNPGS